MRPRFANRGSDLAEVEVGLALAASMRPRFANRGSLTCRNAAGTERKGFNEAPIRESGK